MKSAQFGMPSQDELAKHRSQLSYKVRKWWNWQTHHLEGVAPKGVGVQIPPSPPKVFLRFLNSHKSLGSGCLGSYNVGTSFHPFSLGAFDDVTKNLRGIVSCPSGAVDESFWPGAEQHQAQAA